MQIKGEIAMSIYFNLTILASKIERERKRDGARKSVRVLQGHGERIKGVLLFIRLYNIFFRSHDHQNIPCMFIAYFILVPTGYIGV